MPLLATEADYNVPYLYYLRGEYARARTLPCDPGSFAGALATRTTRACAISISRKCTWN
jgi:hypothetical protein